VEEVSEEIWLKNVGKGLSEGNFPNQSLRQNVSRKSPVTTMPCRKNPTDSVLRPEVPIKVGVPHSYRRKKIGEFAVLKRVREDTA